MGSGERTLFRENIKMKASIGIIGFGRFGQVIHRLFSDGFDIKVSSSTYKNGDVEGVCFDTLERVVTTSQAIFLTVPINKTGTMGARIRPYLSPEHIVVDVCSVKEHPNHELISVLDGTGATIWPTHPMFGPDSTKNGFEGLVWVSCEDDLDSVKIAPFLRHIRSKGLTIVKMTCEAHDRMAARTQGLTHFIGRFLDELHIQPTEIDTLGYRRLMAVREQTCNDTWELFCDLQQYNRFSRDIHQDLVDAIFKVRARFLDATAKRTVPLVGMVVQEQNDSQRALEVHRNSKVGTNENFAMRDTIDTKEYQTVSEVLNRLSMGELDYGVFCIQRHGEGMSLSAFDALGRYAFSPEGFVTLKGVGVFAIVSRRRKIGTDSI